MHFALHNYAIEKDCWHERPERLHPGALMWEGLRFLRQFPADVRQISGQQRLPLRAPGLYPPLGLDDQDLVAAVTPGAQRSSATRPLPCAMIVYVRTGPNEYEAYPVEGGP
jgi:hypothetical protein